MKATKKSARPSGYFGEEGSFSHHVALRLMPKRELVSLATQEEAFQQLKVEKVESIVVPIENASSGVITDTVDQLIALARTGDKRFQILECATLRIRLALLGKSDGSEIRTIYSHPAPFVHARAWLKEHYPKARQVEMTSTSAAAKRVAREPGSAAIAGEHAAALYGLNVLHRDVANQFKNQTQFFVVGPMPASASGTHTTLVFELPHRPGSLVTVLQALSRQGLNLTRIGSRPIAGRLSEYSFMIEFEGDPARGEVAKALGTIRKIAPLCEVLGTYRLRKV